MSTVTTPSAALIFLIIALYLIFKERYILLALLSSAFVWLYGGFRDAVLKTGSRVKPAPASSKQGGQGRLKASLLTLLAASIIILIPYKLKAAKADLRDDLRMFERYKGCAAWLKDNTAGSAVYTTDWDDFP